MFLGALVVGLTGAVTGCSRDVRGPSGAAGGGLPDGGPGTPPQDVPVPPGTATPPPVPVPPGRVPLTGEHVLFHGAGDTREIAWTVDDGYNAAVVAGYVDFAVRTGTHLTFCPNGRYDRAWAPHAGALRPLIERGQVQFVNHTFSHPDLARLSEAGIREELDRNEEWVRRTFDTSCRPYYRPPFGSHTPHVDAVAAGIGFHHAVMWNGDFGDTRLISRESLMESARGHLRPGAIMIGHANHPTILDCFDEITALLRDRDLTPVTLNEMFGTTSGDPRR